MTLLINIPVSNKLYQQAQTIAEKLNKDVSQLISEHLEATFSNANFIDDSIAESERLAYQNMHSSLLKTYGKQYVAIHQGELVDHDANQLQLISRIDELYPDEFVLIRQVLAGPEPERPAYIISMGMSH